MSKQVIQYGQQEYSITIPSQINDLIVSLYVAGLELSLEFKAYLATSLYYLTEIAPVIFFADAVSLITKVASFLGFSPEEEEEVMEWLLNIYSKL